MAYDKKNDLGQEIRFDQELTAEVADDYEPLPAGEYSFTAVFKSQNRFNGSDKIGPCTQINVDIYVEDRTISHHFFMNTKAVKWSFGLNAFFISLGLAKPGQTFRPDWNAIPGRTGRCKLGIRKWTGDDGKDRRSNEVKAFLEPSQQSTPAPQPQQYQQATQQYQQYQQPAQQTTMSGWNPGKF